MRPAHDAAGVIGVFSDQGSSIRGMSWYLRRERWGAGLVDSTSPEDTPWYRRTFTLVLSEGHRLTISGPVRH
ncbi:hypothetical protein ACWEOO_08120 [Kribbella sp. NPDC004138]